MAERDRDAGEALQQAPFYSSPRTRPPSTAMTVPVTYDARVGAEERDDVADLARRAEAAERDRLQVGLGRAVRIHLADALGVDPAGRDRVDGDPLRAELARERLRPADHARADGVREREVVGGLLHGARGDVDDAARAAPLEMRQAEPRQPDDRDEQELDGRLDLLGGEPDRGRPRRPAGVVDQDVDAAEARRRPSSTRRSQSSALVTSPGTARPPSRSASRSSGSGRRANRTTFAPSSASASATPRPIPADAPQTIAVRPVEVRDPSGATRARRPRRGRRRPTRRATSAPAR